MPELPDVEIYKRYLDSTALHQPVESVAVRDEQILADTSPQALGRWLNGRSFTTTHRHGKHLFVGLDNDNWLGLHFGMTGRLDYFKNGDAPEYTQALFNFADDYHLAYVMPRKLGRIRLLHDVDAFIAAQELGPDAMSDDLDLAAFRHLLADRRGMIKSALMDQSFLAGIGNVYADEILFQAGIHPRADIDALSDDDVRVIYRAMRNVLETAVAHDANPDQFPASYLIPHRDEGQPCPHCGGTLQQVDVAGRTGYFCPQCQKRPAEE